MNGRGLLASEVLACIAENEMCYDVALAAVLPSGLRIELEA